MGNKYKTFCCPRCGYESSRFQVFKKHLAKLKLCDNKRSDDIPSLSNYLIIDTKNNVTTRVSLNVESFRERNEFGCETTDHIDFAKYATEFISDNYGTVANLVEAIYCDPLKIQNLTALLDNHSNFGKVYKGKKWIDMERSKICNNFAIDISDHLQNWACYKGRKTNFKFHKFLAAMQDFDPNNQSVLKKIDSILVQASLRSLLLTK